MPDPTTPPEPADTIPQNPSPGEIADATLKARAERAERQAVDLEHKLTDLNDQLEHARLALAETERAHRLDAALANVGALDLDTARLLAQRLTLEDPDADPATIAARLCREKSFLFRPLSRSHSAMAPAFEDDAAITDAARRAAATGDRNALLDYLRARRTA